jgi:adenylate kinase family enzyme
VQVLAYFAPTSVTNTKKSFVTTTPGRSDDNEESLKKRFDTYMNATMQIINIFEEQVRLTS